MALCGARGRQILILPADAKRSGAPRQATGGAMNGRFGDRGDGQPLTPTAPKIRHIWQNMAKSSPLSKTPTPEPAALPELPATYEAAMKELEGLVAGLESGQWPLDQLLTGYQRGAQLLSFCKGRLEAVENQIKVLEGTELKPWAQT